MQMSHFKQLTLIFWKFNNMIFCNGWQNILWEMAFLDNMKEISLKFDK